MDNQFSIAQLVPIFMEVSYRKALQWQSWTAPEML